MEMSKKFRTNSGFTLLEVIVSIAVISILGIVVTQAFLTTSRSQVKTETTKEIKQNGDFAITAMERMIRGASSNATSCINNTVTVTSLDGGISTFGCVFDGSVTRIASTSAAGTQYLTSQAVTLGGADCTGSTLVISCTLLQGVPAKVNVQFTLSQKGTSTSASDKAQASFETSVTTRN